LGHPPNFDKTQHHNLQRKKGKKENKVNKGNKGNKGVLVF